MTDDAVMLPEIALTQALYSGTVDPAEAALIYAKVPVEAFVDLRLRAIYEAASGLFRESPELVGSPEAHKWLVDAGRWGDVGNAEFFCEACDGSTGANALHWARAVAEQHRRRLVAAAALNAGTCAKDPRSSVASGAAVLSEALDEAAVDIFAEEEITAAALARREYKALERRAKGEDDDEFIPSGFLDLDAITGGFVRREMTILAGRPGMGKTAFALCLAQNVAKSRRVLFFSLEMAAAALFARLVTMATGISAHELREAKHVTNKRPEALLRGFEESRNERLSIVESPRSTVLDIAAKVRGAKAAGPLGLVVVDYLQRVRPAADAHSREREVAAISDELSAIAKEFRVPLLVLAQLNREAEKTDNKLPTLGNLRESGTIEQDADVVMFVYRPGYYKRDPGNEGEATIAVAKNRNGDTGRADVRWIGNRMLFQNLETRHG